MFSRILDSLFPSRVQNKIQLKEAIEERKFRNCIQLKEAIEERKFRNYMRSLRKEHDRKHPNAKMACGVSKCQVGRMWTKHDYQLLISAIKEGVTLESLSIATGRSYIGIMNRLKMLGLIKWEKGLDLWTPFVYKRKFYTSNCAEVDIKSMLISVGYIDKGKYLKSPDWLIRNKLQ